MLDPYEQERRDNPYGEWPITGGGPSAAPPPDPVYAPLLPIPGLTDPGPTTNTNTTPPPNTSGPPTRRLAPNERPPNPYGNQGAVWNDDWWDGKSDYLGGWLIPNGTTFGGGGGNTGGGGAQTTGAVGGGDTATAFNWPGYQDPGPFQPRDDTFEYTPFSYGDFSYDPYTESSWQDAEKEPGYAPSREQLRKQIEAGAAHRGMLRSGMTIGDLYTGLDSLGQQNFANFDNRRFRNYSANRGNAFENWSANKNKAFESWSGNLGAAAQKFGLELGVDKDVYDRKATNLDRSNNYNYNVASSQFQDMLSRWQERVRSLTSIATAGANS